MRVIEKEMSSSFLLEDILKPLKPSRNLSKGRRRIIIYKRVNTTFLTSNWIQKKYRERNAKEVPSILKQGDLLLVQYANTPLIVLSLEDGKLYYVPSRDLDEEFAERQASVFLEIIRERVEGFRILDILPKIEWEE